VVIQPLIYFEYEIPYYSNNLFLPANGGIVAGRSYEAHFFSNYDLEYRTQQTLSGAEPYQFTLDFAMGDDMSLVRYVAPPGLEL
jgi:hypothetical protein